MLYQTLSQPLVFLYLFLAGVAGGLVFELFLLFSKFFKHKAVKQSLYFIATIFNALIFFAVNLSVNYGQFRVYALLTFVSAIILERLLLGKFFAIIFKRCYNILNGRKQKKKNH